MRRSLSWVLLVLGALFVALAVPLGHVNRSVLDAPTFADNVDELRRTPGVSEVLGRELSAQLIRAEPDLVAIAPLVDQISIGTMRSDALSGPTRLAASQFQRALTTSDSDQLILRVADVGAVVAGVISAVAPDAAPAASTVSVTLASVGSQSAVADVVALADTIGTLAWLLPLLGVGLLVAVVALAADRFDAVRRIGWAVIVAMVVVAAAIVFLGSLARSLGDGPRADAIVDGVWQIFVQPVWWSIGLVAGVGALLVLVGSGRAAAWDLSGIAERVSRPTDRPREIVLRSLALVALGLALVVEPRGTLVVVAFATGVVLVVTGVARLSLLAGPVDEASDAPAPRTRSRLGVVAGAAGLVLLGVVVWGARPTQDTIAGAVGDAVAGTGEVCNGHAELCDRRFDEVSYAATHNSMSVAGKPGWFIGEQGLDIVPSLDSGVRALLIDVWYGRDAGNGGARTSARSYAEALEVANDWLGPDVVTSALRVFDAAAPGESQGPEALFMCHGLCETGSTPFDATLTDVRAWLATNPDEVVTIFIEDHVEAEDIATAVLDAGLGDYLFTPEEGVAFPTLGEMIRSGQRLVVMVESGDGRPEFPWLVNGFDFVQETPFDFPTVASFSCEPNRGATDAPLLQVNHWLNGFSSLVTDARLVNTADVLGERVERCREERGMQPNLIAVNFADIGDVLLVVDRLNGVD